MKCEVCGQRVGLHEGKEGTNSYIPRCEEMLAIAVDALKKIDACDDVRLGQTMLDVATDALEALKEMGYR